MGTLFCLDSRAYWPFGSYGMYSFILDQNKFFKEYAAVGVWREGEEVIEKNLLLENLLDPFDRLSLRRSLKRLIDRGKIEKLRIGIKLLLKKNRKGLDNLVAFKIYEDVWNFKSESNFKRGLPDLRTLIIEEKLN